MSFLNLPCSNTFQQSGLRWSNKHFTILEWKRRDGFKSLRLVFVCSHKGGLCFPSLGFRETLQSFWVSEFQGKARAVYDPEVINSSFLSSIQEKTKTRPLTKNRNSCWGTPGRSPRLWIQHVTNQHGRLERNKAQLRIYYFFYFFFTLFKEFYSKFTFNRSSSWFIHRAGVLGVRNTSKLRRRGFQKRHFIMIF